MICIDMMLLEQQLVVTIHQRQLHQVVQSNVYDSTFYFMTSAYRVYKVLYNGDQLQTGASNISGAEPTSEIATFLA